MQALDFNEFNTGLGVSRQKVHFHSAAEGEFGLELQQRKVFHVRKLH